MTGVILVVDDVPANVKLLEAKLTNEYYDVVTARDGYEAIQQTKEHKPDLILLDVMMPGMDGFETCRKIKADPDIAHIPIVMVTALSEVSDRLQGLESGADDFITKPINDTALFARVKSLVRIKVLIDELRLRDQSGAQMGIINDIVQGGLDVSGSHIVIVDDDAVQSKRLKEALSEEHNVQIFTEYNEALEHAKQEEPDLIMISTMLMDIDGLRLATQFKAIESLRHVPIITLVDEDDTQIMLKALELGVNDYLIVPVDSSEMTARIKTQLRRKQYQDALKSNYKQSVSMAITDALTGLYNRHYLDTHLQNLTESSLKNSKNMSVIIMDMDHFKIVNDEYGHDVGDEVLKQLANLIVDATRSSDLVARFGGEEFVILMPETDFSNAYELAERIRATVAGTPLKVSHEIGTLHKTLSIGLSSLNPGGDTAQALLKRADTALYQAKNGGRNQVLPKTKAEAAAMVGTADANASGGSSGQEGAAMSAPASETVAEPMPDQPVSQPYEQHPPQSPPSASQLQPETQSQQPMQQTQPDPQTAMPQPVSPQSFWQMQETASQPAPQPQPQGSQIPAFTPQAFAQPQQPPAPPFMAPQPVPSQAYAPQPQLSPAQSPQPGQWGGQPGQPSSSHDHGDSSYAAQPQHPVYSSTPQASHPPQAGEPSPQYDLNPRPSQPIWGNPSQGGQYQPQTPPTDITQPQPTYQPQAPGQHYELQRPQAMQASEPAGVPMQPQLMGEASRATPPGGFDPNLAERSKPSVASSGSGSNQLSMGQAQQTSLYDLNPSMGNVRKPKKKEEKKSYKSPIDDEPPGTF